MPTERSFAFCPHSFQVVVLKSVWNELLTIQLAFRASPYESTLILGSGQLLYRDQGDPDIRRLVGRFIDEIVTPCKAMGLEMAELVSMKALVLFNPGKIHTLVGFWKPECCILHKLGFINLNCCEEGFRFVWNSVLQFAAVLPRNRIDKAESKKNLVAPFEGL